MSNERKVEFQTFRIELDEATNYSSFKKNRINQSIKSLRVGLSSSPSVLLKIKFKEGDEITLWPGRIINLSQASEGGVLSWDAQVNEWVDVEISENGGFDSGDYPLTMTPASGNIGSSYRKNNIVLTNTVPIQIASSNTNRLSMEIENDSEKPIFIGDQALLDSAISSVIRGNTCFKLMPFEKLPLNITGEIWAIPDNSYALLIPNDYRVTVLEILK